MKQGKSKDDVYKLFSNGSENNNMNVYMCPCVYGERERNKAM